MGLYDKNHGLGFNQPVISVPRVPRRLILYLIVGIIALSLLLFLSVSLSEFFKPNPIHARFFNNPLELAHSSNTFMLVRIYNPTPETIRNATITIAPVSPESLIVFPSEHSIPSFGSGEFREYLFVVRPDPRVAVPSGSYTILISVVLGDERFEQEAVLHIETAR